MNYIMLSQLIIPENRQRREFPKAEMETLKNSIVSKGLMHPPVVQNDGQTLVAGERRTRAITELHQEGRRFECSGQLVEFGSIPVTLLGELTPFEIREAELEENVVRLDLTWQDKAAAIAALHQLRGEQKTQTGTHQTFTDTAKELYAMVAPQGEQVSSIHEAVLLTEHLDIPEVRAAKTQKEAVKVLRKIKETEHRAKLAATFDKAKTPHTLLHGSSLELLKTLPMNSFDCILTDPPYGVGADTFGDMAGTGHNYEDTEANAWLCYEALATEGWRVAKAQAHLYAFCDSALFPELAVLFDIVGWVVWPRPLIWDKGNGMLPRPEHGPRNTYECILFASKGDRKTLCVKSDVIHVAGDGKLLHGAQKPVALYEDLLSRTCRPGDTVLDPFGGSGPILPAANSAKCVATYIEISEHNYNIALSRISATSADEINLGI